VPDPQGNLIPRADGSQGLPETLLKWVIRKRLQAPAAMLLQMHRPLMPLAWPAAMLFGGVAAPFFGPDYYQKIEALRDPAALDRLLARLEAPPEDAAKGPPDGKSP
jgi:hypothetical protein